MGSTFENLPMETQQLIFKILYLDDEISDIKECMLVSRSWKSLYERLLYTRVILYGFPQLALFVETLEKRQHLRNLVTDITLGFENNEESYEQCSTIAKLFTLVANLEHIDGSEGKYYKLLLNAILENQLPRLNHMEPPQYDSETVEYTTCAFSLKDRLKIFDIPRLLEDSDDSEFDDSGDGESEDGQSDDLENTHNNRSFQLIDQLHQFKNLETLSIDQETSDLISLIEDSVHQCPTLRQLRLGTSIDTKIELNTEVSNTVISDFLPAPRISQLLLSSKIYNPQLIQYIVHKFPNLEHLEIHVSRHLDTAAIVKLLHYISKIKIVSAYNIPWGEQEVAEATGLFWKTKSQSCSLLIQFSFVPFENRMLVDTTEDGVCLNEIQYFPSSIADERYSKTIKMYGRYIERLVLSRGGSSGVASTHIMDSLYQSFIVQPLIHCVKLKQLTMKLSILMGSSFLNCESIERKTFDVLCLDCCDFENKDVFEELSGLFACVKFLEFSEIRYVDSRYEKNAPYKDINMSKTNIGTLSISKNPYGCKGEDAILVSLLIQEAQTFYIYDFNTMKDEVFSPTTKEIFYKEGKRVRAFIAHISCKSLGTLIVKFLRKEIKLAVIASP